MNWAICTSAGVADAGTFGELPLNGIGGQMGIVSGAIDATLAVGADMAAGLTVVLTVAVEEGAAAVMDGTALVVAADGIVVTEDDVVEGAAGFGVPGVTPAEALGCVDMGGAPAPTSTVRTPGTVLTAATASARAVGVSAHTYASRPKNATVAVRCRASRVIRAWSVRSACIA
jgi:hypothetical protein